LEGAEPVSGDLEIERISDLDKGNEQVVLKQEVSQRRDHLSFGGGADAG
jgi:hypothetical protein